MDVEYTLHPFPSLPSPPLPSSHLAASLGAQEKEEDVLVRARFSGAPALLVPAPRPLLLFPLALLPSSLPISTTATAAAAIVTGLTGVAGALLTLGAIPSTITATSTVNFRRLVLGAGLVLGLVLLAEGGALVEVVDVALPVGGGSVAVDAAAPPAPERRVVLVLILISVCILGVV